MPASFVALQILLLLLPGFAAAFVVQSLATRAPQSDFDKVIEGTLYSFLIYVAYVVCARGALPFTLVRLPPADVAVTWVPGRIGLLAGLTFAIALLAVAYVNLDGTRLFRKVRLTERTSRRSIWNDIFENEATRNQFVQAELGDGRSVLGVLTYYSDAADEGSVYLEQASWVLTDGSQTSIPGPGILLTKNSGIRSISLLDNPSDGEDAP